MRVNTLKQKLQDGKAVFGAMITFPSPPVVEMLGFMGFDWVLIDNEHGSITVDTSEDMIRAAELTGVAPIVRPVANRPEIIAPFLDRGAWGVQVPHVNTASEAVLKSQESGYRRYFLVAADEGSSLHGQVVGAVIQRVEGRELRGQVRRDKLEYVLGNELAQAYMEWLDGKQETSSARRPEGETSPCGRRDVVRMPGRLACCPWLSRVPRGCAGLWPRHASANSAGGHQSGASLARRFSYCR